MAVRVVTTGYGAAALDALVSIVGEIKRDDAMAPVTVIAPNNLAGIVARRHLAARGRGIAGIDVTTLGRLCERLAAPALAPRRPATRPVTAAAWRRALAAEPGQFGEIADHPATVRALVEAHAQLRDLSESALRAVGASTAVATDLVALHESVDGAMREDWYDTTDVLTVAASQLRVSTGACILYLPQALTQAEARAVEALAETTELTVVAAMTGVRRADEVVERSLGKLQLAAGERPGIATATRVINASDSDDEIRCVVREIVETLRRTPAHRVAVLYAARSPYARLLHEHLAAAGVTTNGPGVRPVNERAVARTLLELLALDDRDVPRADLFRALANAPVYDFTGARIPVSRWERISRAAGVVSGADWSVRLDAYVADRHAQIADEQAGDDSRQWLVDRLQRDAAAAAELGAFAARIRGELTRAAAMSTWHELAPWCLDLFTSLVGSEDSLRKVPAEEQNAAASIVLLLRGLTRLDALDSAARLASLREVLELELAASLPRVGRFGEGVLVAPLSAAIGLELDVVYVVGLSEDLYPGRLRPDALLPEQVRQATDGELPAFRDRLNARHRQLLAAFSAARVESVASFPRGDLRRSTLRLPSRWLLPSLRELSGDKHLSATRWDQPQTYDGRLFTAGSFAGELLRTRCLATEQEWRIRQAASGRLDDAVVAAAMQMIRARAADAFTRYDGNLTGVHGLPDYAIEDRAVSPTALEAYAACPHAFFVERLLGVRQLEQPEDILVISPLEIGNLVHESVEALVVESTGSLPDHGQPWTDEQRTRFLQIVEAKADEFERRGLTGHPRLWDGERVRITADALWLLDDDNAWRAQVRARVVASEMPFGFEGQPPVEVAVPGGRVLMRGSADKVDLGADGTIYVTDLKTGSQRTFKDITQDVPVVGGTKLQLPVYAYAARARYGAADTPVHATYWFVRRDRGRLGIDLTPEVEQTYAATLSVLVGSIAQGLFPPRAPEGPDFAWVQCEYCNPDGIGHADIRKQWERKRHDPALRALVGLVEPGALDERQ